MPRRHALINHAAEKEEVEPEPPLCAGMCGRQVAIPGHRCIRCENERPSKARS